MQQSSLKLKLAPYGIGKVTVVLLCGYCLLSLAANICFKQGGTDPGHWLAYFIAGNVLGICSTAVLMGVYARMQVNLAILIVTVGTFLLVQITFWLLFHAAITWLQAVGITLVGIGTTLAVGRPAGTTEIVQPSGDPEPA